jgi:hypothetical protein
MKLVGFIFAEDSPAPSILGLILSYPILVLCIWFVNGDEFVSKIFSTMLDGSILGFIAANIMVVVVGSLCMFFGIPLKLLGVV